MTGVNDALKSCLPVGDVADMARRLHGLWDLSTRIEEHGIAARLEHTLPKTESPLTQAKCFWKSS